MNRDIKERRSHIAAVNGAVWALTLVIYFTVSFFTGALVAGIALKGANGGLGDFSIGFSGNTYADAESYSIGGGSISERISSAEVNWVIGKIDISVYDGETVEISETSENDEDYKLRYKVENGKLTVHSEKSGFELEFDTVSGDIDCEFPLTKKNGKHIYADGSAKFEADSTSGDFTVKKYGF